MKRAGYLALAVWILIPALAQSLTLREAYKVALPVALEWNPAAGLHDAHSADWGDDDPKEGIDGKRSHWYINFSTPEMVGQRDADASETGAGNILFVEVADGKVIDRFTATGPVMWHLIAPEEIPDTTAIARSAIKAGLRPSNDFAFGIHFALYRNDNVYSGEPTVAEIPQGTVFLEVIGRRDPGVLPQEVEDIPGAGSLSYLYFNSRGELLMEIN